ncbi:acyl-CoA dehydrogenase C-terminal domain-containing protein [Paraburkholderia elongata]|uniref:3-methylmercaptopropionyl-CoA dehydrogenase n=1 Tax=Paraburkholderia elongata TaxID=2675747 RepID=A0A972SMR1_9BURK|nr:acyl-CoA dehydrogenase C-terminal domain-containing protein [Paraburkholderia elongata]NPT56880.1 acyl-CoA dehydrogenase [Paraburkholderia elongata]
MPIYKAPQKDYLFLLNDVFHFDRYSDLPGFSDLSPDILEATLEEAAKLCEQAIAPLNRVGDIEGCTRHDDESVTTPTGFKDAFKQLTSGGWLGMSAPAEYGGQYLPNVLSDVVAEFLGSANLAFSMYPLLTKGAVAALHDHGSPELKDTYLPKMVSGEWTGVMSLTEAHCGTDLGLLRTKAVKQADGSYTITGNKIFISAGDHDMADNIVHLVLARLEGAPAGVHGISLFLVPKLRPDADGTLHPNHVSCGSIEHKMGIHGNCTCVMNYDDSTGWLVGEENRGLNAMFTMMNHSRLAVGINGVAIAEVAYQNAVLYARERLQSRSPNGAKFPDKPADPIIVHPDVRRMLMTGRAFTEAARALVVWSGMRHDVASRGTDEKARQEAEDHMGLLTPIIKGFGTDMGFEVAVMAQQIYGGHGYVAENGMEQFVRDARISQIYEGANGVQALDLVGRKLGLNGGRAVMAFLGEISSYLQEHAADAAMTDYVRPMQDALERLKQATAWVGKAGAANRDDAVGASYAFMHLFGLVGLGYMWCRMAEAASRKLATCADGEKQMLNSKLVTGQFFMDHMLPATTTYLARITAGSASMMALPAEAF